MKKFISIMLSVLILSGCASTVAYRDYMTAYSGYLQTSKIANPNSGKLVEIEAVDGQPITINARKFTVYAPIGSNGNDSIRPPEQIKNSEWVNTVDRIAGGALTLGSTAIIGSIAKHVFDSAVTNAGHNTTSTYTDSGNTTSTNTSTNTNSGNTTTNTDSGNTTTTTTTTTTDSHNTDSHNTDSHNTP